MRCESLQFLNGVVRGEIQEGSDQMETFVIREMRRRTFLERLPVEILEKTMSVAFPSK